MSFSQDFIEKVRDANNIVDLFEEYTSFKRSSGGQAMGRCPLPGHNEKTASFSVSEPKQVYHCFGCGKSGSIFDALRELKNLNFPEAVEYLATRAGISIPSDMKKSNGPDRTTEIRNKLIKINRVSAEYFQKNFQGLDAKNPIKMYAEKRGLNQEIQEQFKIGYATDEWEGLQKQLIRLKAPLKMAQDLGLLKPRQKGNGTYDLFRNRLMFPIQDHKGDFVGFGGRALSDDQQPKYLNSSDSEVFHKGSVFYGLNVTSKYIRESDQVILVEGYMDLLALYAVGIRNVVATLGTALTDQHARLLQRFTKNVLVLFDGDSAGQKAAERSLPTLLRGGLIPRGLILPNKMDPDDFVKANGVEALRALIEKAPELFVLFLDQSLIGFTGTAAQKLKTLDRVSPILAEVKDVRLRRLYSEEIARRLGVEIELVEKSMRVGTRMVRQQIEAITDKAAQNVIKEGSQRVRLAKAPKAEIFLLNLALMSAERLHAIWTSEVVDEFSHPGAQELLTRAYESYRQNPNEFAKLTAYLMGLTDSASELGLHLGKGFQDVATEELNRMQSDCIFQVKERFKKAKLREITARMRGQPAQDQLKELEQIVNMNKESMERSKSNINTKKKSES